MTKAKPIQVDCTECRGKAGGLCLFDNGKPRKSFHDARKEKAAATEAPLPKCTDCGSDGFKACRFDNGKPRKSPHPVRLRAARATGERPKSSPAPKVSAAMLRKMDTKAPRGAMQAQQEAYLKLGLKWSPEAIRESSEKWKRNRKRGATMEAEA